MEIFDTAITSPGRLVAVAALVAAAGTAAAVVGVWALKLLVAVALHLVPA